MGGRLQSIRIGSLLSPIISLLISFLSGCGLSINPVQNVSSNPNDLNGTNNANTIDHASITFTYPFKNGLRVGESDETSYTIEGTCNGEGSVVKFSINSGAITDESSACASGTFSANIDLSSLDDGPITITTTNATTNATLRMFKDTAYCTPARKAASPFAGGTGDPWDPYKICTPTQFQQISTDDNAHFELRNNIDYTGITTGEGIFGGVFNGNNFQITNVNIGTVSDDYVGLFSIPNSGAEIENLHLKGSITGDDWVGAFSGYTPEGVYQNLSFVGTMSCGDYCAGIFGQFEGGQLRYSYTSITSTGTAFPLVGNTSNGNRLFRNYTNSTTQNITGGLLSALCSSCSVVESFATGSLTTNLNAGGFANIISGEIADSYSTVNITATDASEDNYYTFVQNTFSPSSGIFNTFSTGLLTHPDNHVNKGGSVSFQGTVSNSFFNAATTGQSSGPAGNTALTSDQFADSSNFTGFDFTNVWAMQSDRPKLKWEETDTLAPVAPTFIFPNADNYPLGYTDLNTIGTYEVEGRCSESQWPVKLVITYPDTSSETVFTSCHTDNFWGHTLTLESSWNDSETVTIVASQMDGAGNTSNTATRVLEVNLPAVCVTNRAGSPFADGSGTVGDPWVICTNTQLGNVLSQTAWNQAGIYFQLGDSIDFGGANISHGFQSRSGEFDGKNFRLNNIARSSTSDYAHILDMGSILTSNLHFFNSNLTSTNPWASGIGSRAGLDNISFRGNLSSGDELGVFGTDIGDNYSLSNSYFRGNLTVSGGDGGALVSTLWGANVSVTNNLVRGGTFTRASGIAEWFYPDTSSAVVSNNRIYVHSITEGTGAFGSIFSNGANATVSQNEIKIGLISNTNSSGVFVGYTFSVSPAAFTFSNNSVEARSVVVSQAGESSGGFGGYWDAGTTGIFNNNRVVVNLLSSPGNSHGFLDTATAHSYTGNFVVGFLNSTSGTEYGWNNSGIVDTVNSNNFFDSRTSGTSTTGAGTAKAAHEMYRQSTYTGFDFTSGTGVWKMPAHGGYPLLQWQYDAD